MSAYRCATCDIQYQTRRALTNHLRKHKEPHAACNNDCGHRSSSATNTTYAKQTSYSVLPDSSFDTSEQPAAYGGGMVSGGGIPGLYAGIAVARAHSPDSFEVGNSDMLSNNFESPVAESSIGVSHQLPDTSLCDKLDRHLQSGHGSTPLSPAHTSEFKLLSICKPYSLKLYDEITQ